MFQCGLQQIVGTHDIGLDELPGAIDATIDVTFGREMQDGIRLILGNSLLGRVGVGDIDLGESIVGMGLDVGQGGGIAGVGEGVEVEDFVAGVNRQANEVAADEATAASDEEALTLRWKVRGQR